MFCNRSAVGLGVSFFTLAAGLLPVVADVFTVDPNQTSFTISGSVQGTSFSPQAPGSLTATYGGTIQASQTAGSIQFTGLSLITAQTNGSWFPLAGGGGGTAPADYGAFESLFGGFVTVDAAFRSMVLDVTSPPVIVTGGQFDPSGLTFLFPTNATSALDYKESGFSSGSGSILLTGNATNNVASLATLATVGSQQTLTLGVNTQFTFSILSGGDTIVNVVGQIVATRSTTAPLVIQNPLRVGQLVTLNWQAPAGQMYQVLSSSNLQTWQTNASNITSGSTNYAWSGTNPASRGFYRLSH